MKENELLEIVDMLSQAYDELTRLEKSLEKLKDAMCLIAAKVSEAE